MGNALDEILQTRVKLHGMLQGSPESIILGIVDSMGPTCSRGKSETKWSFQFNLAAWKFEGGAVKREKLKVIRFVDGKEKDIWMDLIRPETIIKIRAKILERNPLGDPHALIVELISQSDDLELAEFLKGYTSAKEYHDEYFGKLAYDRKLEWFESEQEWDGRQISLVLNSKNNSELKAIIETARSLWDNWKRWESEVKDFAVNKLLNLKNDNWTEGVEDIVNAKEFLEKMSLESIQVDPNGDFIFWYDDGDLFWGHTIQISGNIEKGIQNADIAG